MFIPHYVNGIEVEQRNTDGFINGTAMCVAHDKNIIDWFRTERTYELFKFIFNENCIKSNMVLHHDSDISRLSATRYLEIFPGLLFVKRGSPVNGGGVWVHPDLAVDLASFCNAPFAIQVGRWIREWFSTGKNPIQSETDLDQEAILWQQRNDIRVDLKDYLRPELMNAVVAYAKRNGLSCPKLCSEVHDMMNHRIQGKKAKDIRLLNGLPLGDLIRDYFETKPLVMYASINKIAKNRIEDSNIHPVQAVNDACDMYLGSAYQPKLFTPVENIHSQGRRVLQAKKRKALGAYQRVQRQELLGGQQLSLFSDVDEAI